MRTHIIRDLYRHPFSINSTSKRHHSFKFMAILAFGFVILFTFAGCGSSNDSDEEPSIEAPKLPEANSKGLVFTSLNHDLSAGNSCIYFYNFKEGTITKLSQGESADPILFALGNKAVLFNRHSNLKNYKIIDPFTPDSSPKGININLVDGDPADGLAIDSTQDLLLLASPLGQKLQTLRLSTGVINSIDTSSTLQISTIRPLSLHRVGQNVSIAHSGLVLSPDGVGKSDGSQQLLSGSINGETLTFNDSEPSNPKIDGSALTATYPLFLDKKGIPDFKVVGLCNAQMQGCQAGVDLVSSNKAQRLSIFTKSDQARYFDQFITAGGVGDQAAGYGIIGNDRGEIILGKVSLKDGSIESTLKVYGQKRLFGLAYEAGSQTLIAGDVGEDSDSDSLLLFRDNKLIKKIKIDGVFYRGVLVD